MTFCLQLPPPRAAKVYSHSWHADAGGYLSSLQRRPLLARSGPARVLLRPIWRHSSKRLPARPARLATRTLTNIAAARLAAAGSEKPRDESPVLFIGTAAHVRQLGGVSPLHNLIEVK